MRYFVAVDLESHLLAPVQALQNELSRAARLSVVKPANLHFTLMFLGLIDRDTIAVVIDRLRSLTMSERSFQIHIRGVGAFPSLRSPRVVWVGAPELLNLHQKIAALFADMFASEKAVPHLTLARVKHVTNKQSLEDFLTRRALTSVGTMTVETIKLKGSLLNSHGPIYQDISSFQLMGSDDG